MPECSSGEKERKLLSVFWLTFIQLKIQVYMKAMSSNMNLNENFTISFNKHSSHVAERVSGRNNILKALAGTSWGQIQNLFLTAQSTQIKSVISVPINDFIHHYPMALFNDIPRVGAYFYDIPGSGRIFTTYPGRGAV